jgi:hypothetical protein
VYFLPSIPSDYLSSVSFAKKSFKVVFVIFMPGEKEEKGKLFPACLLAYSTEEIKKSTHTHTHTMKFSGG